MTKWDYAAIGFVLVVGGVAWIVGGAVRLVAIAYEKVRT